MSDRSAAIGAFLASAGWGGAAIAPLAGDASFRHYHRLRDNGARAVLMDAPPEREDVRPFVRIARHLGGLGFSAPAILAADEAQGPSCLRTSATILSVGCCGSRTPRMSFTRLPSMC